ncbi:MAG: phosphotransferase [Chlorobi bacterium]|nr:phosphotransferase [Chlorobiota bacterium]
MAGFQLAFSNHFKKIGLPVPQILAHDETMQYFLLQDLGDTHLLTLVIDGLTEKVKDYYRQVINDLVRFQTKGIKGLDMKAAYPVKTFDKRSVFWDLNYFKYYFVKPHELLFDEGELENDFNALANRLLEADSGFFQYRDFQARNIMIYNEHPWYIDFQGGRKGPLQYDLASLLYQARAGLPQSFRDELYRLYLEHLEKAIPGQAKKFEKYFADFIYFRLMQVLGAYGFRGLIQRKSHFLKSIPPAIGNLKQLNDTSSVEKKYPELYRIFMQITQLNQYEEQDIPAGKLTVSINSFSYKKTGYPADTTENGGGFVFDCRALPNPGRIKELQDFTGLERPVIEYFQDKSEVNRFMTETFKIVKQSIESYLERGFTHLQVDFGCTGGKHRSVYCARQLSDFINMKYNALVEVRLRHIDLEKEKN